MHSMSPKSHTKLVQGSVTNTMEREITIRNDFEREVIRSVISEALGRLAIEKHESEIRKQAFANWDRMDKYIKETEKYEKINTKINVLIEIDRSLAR